MSLVETIEAKQQLIDSLIIKRNSMPGTIMLSEMPEKSVTTNFIDYLNEIDQNDKVLTKTDGDILISVDSAKLPDTFTKCEHEEVIIKDLIQGEITVENTELDDMIMLRSDGSPTYMLAVVVDDHDMNITHIIRGDDHLTNAFRQKQIYEAMGWKIPEFAHIPLILDKDGKKLSKRAGALGIEEYKKLGYLPEAVNNHLLRLGFGHGNDEIIPMPDAINIFTLDGVGKSSARFDIEKLNFINAHYMRLKSDRELFELVEPNLADKSPIVLERVKKGITGLKTRAHTLVELAELAKIYIAKSTDLDDKSKEVLSSFGSKLLPDLITLFSAATEWNKDSIQNSCNEFATTKQLKASQIMQTLRVTVLGTLAGPSIYEVIEILGKEETLARMGHA
jgi:glutamyl-tRNA synthetase